VLLGWSDQGERVGQGIGMSEEEQKCIQSFIEHFGALTLVYISLTLSFIFRLSLSSEFLKNHNVPI
jgi:hypothetical protein